MAGASDQAGDRLLWLAGGVVVLMGLAWLVVEAPWSASEPVSRGAAAIAPADDDPLPAPAKTTTRASVDSARDPLRTARMALDAGMLIEPPDYSAWDLFGKAADAAPDNVEAREGLEQVAAALLQRGNTALEQGRYEDAGGIAATITGRFPRHAGALALAAEVATATAPPEPPRRAAQREPDAAAVAAAADAAPARTDPIPALHDAFQAAMAQNAVLRPAGAVKSAVDVVREMRDAAPDHELTIATRDLLVTEMLNRSAQSIEALDARAARTWIDAARPLAADPAPIARAEERLNEHLIETETQRMVPASAFEAVRTEPAQFPKTALNRGIEGWVEIEFVVSTSGNTEDVTVVDASHERYFREEAVAAVEGWQFEPYVFMGRAIPKRAYTRLEFVLN